MGEMSADRAKRAGHRGIQGVSALGWVSFFSLFCAGCSGLPVLAGLFGGLALTTRFGVSVGIVSALMLTVLVFRRRRQPACALPAIHATGDR